MLGHASATMTMDLYGHLVDGNLWQAPGSPGASRGHLSCLGQPTEVPASRCRTKMPGESRFPERIPSPYGMKDRESSLQEAELTGPGHGLAA